MLFVALVALAAACSSAEERAARWPEANEDNLAAAVRERLLKIQQCWDAGAKRSSFLPGPVQVVRVDVKPKGVVRAAFVDGAHNKHPVGSCVRSAFDGLRFAPREAPIAFEVPLRLGQKADGASASAPFQVPTAAP